MAKEGTKGEEKKKDGKSGKITFRCQSCEKSKPIEEMRVVYRFFPMPVLCLDCAEKIR